MGMEVADFRLDTFGDIRSKREELGIPQWYAAKYIGVSWTAYQRWENGITKVTTVERGNKLKELLSGNVKVPEDVARKRNKMIGR